MKRKLVFELIGFRYLVNHHTREVHRVGHLTAQCSIKWAARLGYATGMWAWWLVRYRGYNGCYFCWRRRDSDRRKSIKN
jgi:hypothetical protein